jgi:hypothetical protein
MAAVVTGRFSNHGPFWTWRRVGYRVSMMLIWGKGVLIDWAMIGLLLDRWYKVQLWFGKKGYGHSGS